MKRSSLLPMFSLTLVAIVLAQSSGQTGSFKDQAGKFGVSGILSPEVRSDPQNGTLHFEFTGKPLTGYSKDQGLEFRANHAEGDLKRADKSYNLQAMTIKGDAWMKVSKNDTKKKTSTEVEATSDLLTITDGAESAKIVSPGRITVVSNGVGEGKRRVELRGPNATLTVDSLTKQSDDPVRSAVMTGGVTVVVDSVAIDKDGKESRVSMTATGDRLDYDRTTREVVLSGNVTVKGTSLSPGKEQDLVFDGTLTGKEFRLKLDKGNEIVSWSLGQGKAAFREGG